MKSTDHGVRRPQARAAALACLLALLICGAARAQQESRVDKGQPLTQALSLLQQQGLRILFSSALVRPDMVVLQRPRETRARALLDEILAPHDLQIQEGPNGQLIVVRKVPDDATTGSIHGRVETEGDPGKMAGVTIQVIGTEHRGEVDRSGHFTIDGLAPGHYRLQAASAAFLPGSVSGITVAAGQVTEVLIALVPASVFLNEIVVTPSHFRILDEQPEHRQFLSHEEVDQMPHVADDLYRAVKRLPGAASTDLSAQFHIRGGNTDEVLVLLDGLELYEPFHLKDFQSIFSTIDAEAVGGVDFLTGGFPVEYGDRMSGVMDIHITSPTGPTRTSLGVGTLNSRLLSQGTFDHDNGQWLVSGRGWYPDSVYTEVRGTDLHILSDYYDLLAKLEHKVGAHSTLAVDFLFADDKVGYGAADEDEVEQVSAGYRSHHLWCNLRTQWRSNLFSSSVLSSGRVLRQRRGGIDDVEEGTIDITDDRSFDFVGLKQEWTMELDERHLFKWGIDLKYQRADYGYTSAMLGPKEGTPPELKVNTVDLEPDGVSSSIWLADRVRLGESLVGELGLRWDRQSWTPKDQLSPRLNLRYDLSDDTILRLAWGRFFQTQRLNELQVEDGVREFYPAQLAEHWLASVEHQLPLGIGLRVEAYVKELDRLWPRYENLFDPLQLFPEARDDRVLVAPEHGRSRGVELLLRSDRGRWVQWWLTYSFGRAEDEIGGVFVPRSWDQRHAASLGLNLSLPHEVNLNLSGTFHTGWPTTAMVGEVVGWEDGEPLVELTPGQRNRQRYPDYYRFDLRASKQWTTTLGELGLVFEVINFTARDNIRSTEDWSWVVTENGVVEVTPELRSWSPIVPSLSINWQF